MKPAYKLLFILFFLFGCSDMFEPEETHYIIQKGQHSSIISGGLIGDKLRTLKQNRFEFLARFDESVRYNLENDNQYDINKLMGFSEANQNHQQNSVRFGWRYSVDLDRVEIFAYSRKNGALAYELISTVAIGENVLYQIFINDGTFRLQVADSPAVEIARVVNQRKGVYYLLYPYFGGNETAPHDIHIYVKEIFH